MRQLSTTLLIVFLILINILPSYSAYKGGVSYSLPIEYRNLSETELNDRAKTYYYNANRSIDGVLTEDMSNALFLYSILQNLNPNNPMYPVKLGILYDKLGKDRYAKSEFSRAIGVNSYYTDTYFYFGEFYYKRQCYGLALKYYKKALESSKNPSYDIYYKLGDVYEKLGETDAALKYLNMAAQQNPNAELENKINYIKTFGIDSLNYDVVEELKK